MNFSVLVVDDDNAFRAFVVSLLMENGYKVLEAESGLKALAIVEKLNPDLIILDLKLPDIQGESLCSQIKEMYPDTQVLITSAKDTPAQVAAGFEIGADDYIKKPIAQEEFLARIKARSKNISNNQLIKLIIKDIEIDLEKVQVKKSDKLVSLTSKEFRLLEYLVQNKNKVISREVLLNRVWEYPLDIDTRVVDVYIGYLRKKLKSNKKDPLIKSVRSFGYMISDT